MSTLAPNEFDYLGALGGGNLLFFWALRKFPARNPRLRRYVGLARERQREGKRVIAVLREKNKQDMRLGALACQVS